MTFREVKRTMLHIKNGKFTFDRSMIRQDPAGNLKDLWFREHACARIYEHWLATLQDPSMIEMANWCMSAHRLNADKLHSQMLRLGDDVHLTDHWRDLASIPDMLATSLGTTIAVSDLGLMETDLLNEYLRKLQNFDGENLDLLQKELLPVQYKCLQAWGPTPS